jgi:hypothetical protein
MTHQRSAANASARWLHASGDTHSSQAGVEARVSVTARVANAAATTVVVRPAHPRPVLVICAASALTPMNAHPTAAQPHTDAIAPTGSAPTAT